ncbi:conserved repeat domain-containing protein [Haloarcula vallismortis]|uniref:DUF58 domain-containing protein n=2 Tax=Haloarcula vallismortis TaxID=28442 RepID=M0IX72_HALVA|nr:DUF58 domain-containing protein [Haloarcula vallismortis]EMA00653.1 hypothetical protein C437_17672 [Haloarcula vallismortis ATCC 29715]SDW02341.1 conserved repeat domain-containing protein [Haloarcula vallismortis]
MHRRVRRWSGGLAAALFLVSVSLLTAEPLLLAATAIPLIYVAYGALLRLPAGTDLQAARTVSDAQPTPGEPVAVELTLTNTGRSSLTDVRVIDGVPEELAVVEGSPRLCTSLRPDESATLSYAVMAKRGTYTFDAAAVRVRTLSASDEVTVDLTVAGDGTVTCSNTVSEVPMADATLPRAGTLPTDTGGSGLEFHSTRSYQPGDPVNRIDWRRYAKTDELTTIDYREEQAVRTVLVVDARPPARVTPEPGFPTGAELSAYAAERLFDALSRTSVVASVCAVGLAPEDVPGGLGPDGLAWVDASGGHAAAHARQIFDSVGRAAARQSDTDAAGDAGASEDAPPHQSRSEAARVTTADGGTIEDPALLAVLARLPPTAQVVVFSPAADDWPVSLVSSLAVRDYPTTLVSPSLARGDSLGAAVASTERVARLQRAELSGATVIDWDLDSPIDVALRASLADLFSV